LALPLTWLAAFGLARLGGSDARVGMSVVGGLAMLVAAMVVAGVAPPTADGVRLDVGLGTAALALVGAATWFVRRTPEWPPVGAATRLRFMALAAALPWGFGAVRAGDLAPAGLDAVGALPAWLLLAAAGAVAAHDLLRPVLRRSALPFAAQVPATVAVALVVELGVETVLYHSVHDGMRPPWRQACRRVQRELRGDTAIVLADAALLPAAFYLRPSLWAEPAGAALGPRLAPAAPLLRDAAALAALAPGAQVWLLAGAGEVAGFGRDHAVEVLLRRHFELVAVLPAALGAADGGVWLWRRRDAD
jgi:hypothetical protein